MGAITIIIINYKSDIAKEKEKMSETQTQEYCYLKYRSVTKFCISISILNTIHTYY